MKSRKKVRAELPSICFTFMLSNYFTFQAHVGSSLNCPINHVCFTISNMFPSAVHAHLVFVGQVQQNCPKIIQKDPKPFL